MEDLIFIEVLLAKPDYFTGIFKACSPQISEQLFSRTTFFISLTSLLPLPPYHYSDHILYFLYSIFLMLKKNKTLKQQFAEFLLTLFCYFEQTATKIMKSDWSIG